MSVPRLFLHGYGQRAVLLRPLHGLATAGRHKKCKASRILCRRVPLLHKASVEALLAVMYRSACGVVAAFHFLLPPHPMWVDVLTALVDSFFFPYSVASVGQIAGKSYVPRGGAPMTLCGWAIGGVGFAILTYRVLPSVAVWMAIILGVVAATVVVGIITYIRDIIWIYR